MRTARNPATTAYLVLVTVNAVQRVAELRLSRRHARALLAAGGVETGTRQLPLIMILNAGLLGGCVAEPLVAGHRPRWAGLAAGTVVVGAAQLVRVWTMRTLGRRWTAKVIVLPDHERVRDGPYRWLAHPNYLAVAAEGAALPLAGGARITAAAFTLLNLPVLAIRIRTEERALRPVRAEQGSGSTTAPSST